MITVDQLNEFVAHYPIRGSSKDDEKKRQIRQGYFDAIASMGTHLEDAGLFENHRWHDFIAQVAHECAGFTIVEENLFYTTAARIKAVWPTRFPTIASALPYLRNPKGLANKVYGGRMGNQHIRNGGWLYRGRGALQTTGADGYKARADRLAMPNVFTDPDVVANDYVVSLLCALDEWAAIKGNELSDAGKFNKITRRINGGYTNLEDRVAWRNRAGNVWGKITGDAVATGENVVAIDPARSSIVWVDKNPDILEPGDRGERVRALQRRLVELGYPLGDVDGKFGDLTGDALTLYKSHHGLNREGLDPDQADNSILAFIDSPNAPRRPEHQRAGEDATALEARGSTTIAAFRWMKRVGATILGFTGLQAVDTTAASAIPGLGLENIVSLRDTFVLIRSALEPLIGVMKWATSEPLVFGAFVGVCIYGLATWGIRSRVGDHQSLKNLGR